MPFKDYLSLAMSVIAITLSIYVWLKNRIAEKYKILDDRLLSILRINLDHPEFDDSTFTARYAECENAKLVRQYEIYAMIVWNFLESLYEYYGERKLKRTSFFGVITYWSKLHQEWFAKPENNNHYTDKFRAYVAKLANMGSSLELINSTLNMGTKENHVMKSGDA